MLLQRFFVMTSTRRLKLRERLGGHDCMPGAEPRDKQDPQFTGREYWLTARILSNHEYVIVPIKVLSYTLVLITVIGNAIQF